MSEALEYGLCFSAATVVCLMEGLVLLALFFGGLAIRAVWSKLTGARI